MPFKSEAQRRYMWKMHPDIAKKWEAEYKQIGGQIGGAFKTGFAEALDTKVRDALNLGVPKQDIDRVLKNNAMRARNAQTRAALLGAGLEGLGRAQQNQAGLITQAGLDQQAFTPDSGAGAAVASGLRQAGAAEAGYQEELSQIERDKLEREEAAQEKADKEAEAIKIFRQYSISAQKALSYVDPATKALNYLSEAEGLANAAYAVSAATPIVNQGTAALNQVREDAIHKYMRDWGSKSQNASSYEAFKLLEASVTELTTTALKAQGPGPKTDFDFVVAARSTADLSATPVAIKKSLQRLIYNANEEITAAGQKPPKWDGGDTQVVVPNATTNGTTKGTQSVPAGQTSDAANITQQSIDEAQIPTETEEKPLEGEIVHTQNLEGTEYSFIEIPNGQVPTDVRTLFTEQGEPKNKPIVADDGYIYIYYDGNLFDLVWPKWIKSNIKDKEELDG